jgi:hypothetical protein
MREEKTPLVKKRDQNSIPDMYVSEAALMFNLAILWSNIH